MSTLDTILDKALNNGYTVLTIDEPTRSIKYDGDLLLGVEGDKYAERIYFVAPKIVGDGIDLSADTTRIDVKFTNGYGDSYYVECNDAVVQKDGNVMFSWLLTEKVAVTYGNVSFTVCVKTLNAENTVEKEWHTVPHVGKISKGVETTLEDVEILTDFTVPTYEMVQEFNAFNSRLDDFWDEVANKADMEHDHAVATSSQNGFMSASDKTSVLQSASDIVTLKNNITDINSDIDAIRQTQETFETNLDSYKGVATQFQRLTHQNLYKGTNIYADITGNSTGYIDLGDYMDGYNELMIMLKVNTKSDGTNECVGIAMDSSSVTNNMTKIDAIQLADAPSYNVIYMNKTNDNCYAWTIDGRFNWTSDKMYKYLYHYSGGSTNNFSIIVKVYGR